MKRFTTLIALLSVMLVAVAQRPLVTLSHNGELSFFSNLSAFEEALDSAQNGDIIYLSEGDFATSTPIISLTKRVSIIGCGYKSHLLSDLNIHIDSDFVENEFILFDGIRLQKVTCSSSHRNVLKNVTVKKSWVKEFYYFGRMGKNITINSCLIEKGEFDGLDGESTLLIQNSKIFHLVDYDLENINIVNSNIKNISKCPNTIISSIIDNGNNTLINSGGKIINSLVLGVGTLEAIPSDQVFNCYIYIEDEYLLDSNLETSIDLFNMGYLGTDGTVVGVYGGEFPFSENPSVPTVDSANSKVEYDAENNKLNVTISITPN